MTDKNSLARKVQKVKVRRVMRPENRNFNCNYILLKSLFMILNNKPTGQEHYDSQNSRTQMYHKAQTD